MSKLIRAVLVPTFCRVLLMCSVMLPSASAQLFKTGDKICFVGNSITMNGGFYHQLAVFYATRYPEEKVEFINCGINGNVAANVLSRMDSDILVNKPTWVVLMLGMNDVKKDLYHPDSAAAPGLEQRRIAALNVYRNNYQLIIERLLKEKCKVILQTPSIYDQTAKIPAMNYVGRNDALWKCSEIVRDLAVKYKLPVVDYQGIMLKLNREMQATNSSATLIGQDRVHPGEAGHFVMAYQFLKTTLPDAARSVVSLDFGSKTETNFNIKEAVLPFPIEKEAVIGAGLVRIKAFNKNRLQVNGCKAGQYILYIDSTVIGKFTAQELSAGIDLNVYHHTPQYVQSLKVLDLFRRYWKLEADNRYVKLVESYHQPQNERYLALKAQFNANAIQMSELLDQIYQVNKPVEHQIKLTPIGETIDLVAASQAGASDLFFEALSGQKIQVSTFRDDRELQRRNGLSPFFAKLKAGKPVTIAYIGGSVTQMENKYRNQSARFLQETYPNVEMTFINAGVSGTGTDLAAARLDYQVLKYKPDLVFVEFAVNGSYVPGLEGVIRQIHKADPQTGVCLLYSISNGQSALYAKGQLPENIVHLERLADYYGIPSIHMGVEVSTLEAEGKLVWKADPGQIKDKIVFSKDGTHPTTAGGSLYAAAIARSFKALARNNVDVAPQILSTSFPSPLTADNWEDASAVDPYLLKSTGNWKKVNPAKRASLKQFTPWFPDVMEAEAPGSSIYFSFEGTKVGVFDIGGPEVGQLEVYIDGKKHSVINRFNRFCNNRYRGQYFFVETKPGMHKVEFRVSAEIADKRSILGDSQLDDISRNPEKYNRRVIYLGKVLIKGKLITEGQGNVGLADSTATGKRQVATQNEASLAMSASSNPTAQARDTSFNIFTKLPKANKTSLFHGYEMVDFVYNGRNCKVVKPKWSAMGHPWVWRARFWGHEPQFDKAMLERGFHVVYCDVVELYGNREAVDIWNKFYALMYKAGLARKVVMEGMSRGGVYVYNWAAENPSKVACVYADNPVLDLKSWPGGLYAGPGGKADWQKVILDYKLDSQKKIDKFKGSPINKIKHIVKGEYPMLHVCGDADELVPMSENTLPFERLIKAAEGDITVMHKPGAKHHPHSLVDPQPIVDFVLRAVFK